MPKLLLTKRKKINVMINESTLEDLENFVPEGRRSDFINTAIESMLQRQGRKRAFDFFETFQKNQKKTWTTRNIITFVKHERRRHLS